MLKKYEVWATIDQLYIVKAKSKEEARDMVDDGRVGDEDIIKEQNQEIFSIEEVK